MKIGAIIGYLNSTQQKRKNSDLSSFGVSSNNMQVSESIDSKLASKAIKNNYMSNVSFEGESKGYSLSSVSTGTAGERRYEMDLSGRPNVRETYYYYPSYSYSSSKEKATPEEIIAETCIKKHNLFHNHSSIEKTASSTKSVYFADPEEFVSYETKSNHSHIVYDNRPEIPTLDSVKQNYFNHEADAQNFGQLFRDIAEYYYRLEMADKRELGSLRNEKRNFTPEYNSSLEYKNDLEAKMAEFPWDVDSIAKDKEKADYFFSQNQERMNNLDQKIWYYSDRIKKSKAIQHAAIQGYRVFDEVGLKFMERDTVYRAIKSHRAEIAEREGTPYARDQVSEGTAINKKYADEIERLKAKKEVVKGYKNLKEGELETAYTYDKTRLREEITKLEKEINSINYSIRQLEEKIEYNEKIIESYQDSLDRSRMRAEKCEQELPEMLERYQALCSEIESDYPKMEEFYNSRIYTL